MRRRRMPEIAKDAHKIVKSTIPQCGCAATLADQVFIDLRADIPFQTDENESTLRGQVLVKWFDSMSP